MTISKQSPRRSARRLWTVPEGIVTGVYSKGGMWLWWMLTRSSPTGPAEHDEGGSL
jgi:hypothetical protein